MTSIRVYKPLAAALLLSMMPLTANAAPITLTLKDSLISITGDFVGFNANAYVVATSSGTINVPADYADCSGPDCISFFASDNN